MTRSSPPSKEPARPVFRKALFKGLTWLVATGCFYFVYRKISLVAAQENQTAWQYLAEFFQAVDWLTWLALMIPYSCFFFLVDSHASWRVIRWFNAPDIRFGQILPIRASAYILSLLNEQVGKGAISLYLLKKHQIPIWQALSSMIYISMMEIYQLLLFVTVGLVLYFDLVQQASTVLPLTFFMISAIAVAALYFPVHVLYFKGTLLPDSGLRDKPLLHAFRRAKLHQYALLVLFKAPNLIGAVVTYTFAVELFNVPVQFGQMLALLPVIFLAAALPLPFHAGALVLWTLLYPEFPQVGAFSLVMSVFFVSFNAFIGLCFLPKVNRELFAETTDEGAALNPEPGGDPNEIKHTESSAD